jgi:hypothetical protein
LIALGSNSSLWQIGDGIAFPKLILAKSDRAHFKEVLNPSVIRVFQ